MPRLPLLVALACGIPLLAQAGDWPQWRGPHRDGVSDETRWVATWPAAGPRILWKAEVGKGCASVAVAHGRLYTMGNIEDGEVSKDVVWCLDAATGAVLWQFSYPQALEPSGYEGGPCVTPCVDGDFVYSLSKRGRAWCFEAATGKVRWDTNPGEVWTAADGGGFNGGQTSSPLVEGDLLITGARALRKETGALVWELKPEQAASWASPVPYRRGGRATGLFFNTRGLTSVSLGDGSVDWSYPLASDACSAGADPLLYAGGILLCTRPLRRGDPSTVFLQPAAGAPAVAWSRNDVVSNFQERVVWQDHAYGCDAHRHTKGDATLKCLDLKTGEVAWSEPEYDWGQLIASDGKLLIIRHGDLSIVAATPAAYRLLARTSLLRNVQRWPGAENAVGTTAVAPVLAHGRLYCRGGTGDLVCLDLSP